MAILATLGTWAAKTVGGHLLSGNGVSKIEGAVTGLGMRFILGFGSALYLKDPAVREAINHLLVAIKNSVL